MDKYDGQKWKEIGVASEKTEHYKPIMSIVKSPEVAMKIINTLVDNHLAKSPKYYEYNMDMDKRIDGDKEWEKSQKKSNIKPVGVTNG